jgi:hypothetical protein
MAWSGNFDWKPYGRKRALPSLKFYTCVCFEGQTMQTSRSALFWHITQCWVVVMYRRFGTTYRFPYSRVKKSKNSNFLTRNPRTWTTSWRFKMGPIGCPETSVQNYHSTLRNIAQESRAHLHSAVSLKSPNANITNITQPRLQPWNSHSKHYVSECCSSIFQHYFSYDLHSWGKN